MSARPTDDELRRLIQDVVNASDRLDACRAKLERAVAARRCAGAVIQGQEASFRPHTEVAKSGKT